MEIKFTCPHCQAAMKAPSDKAGCQGKCSKCGMQVVVPTETELVSPEEQATSRFVNKSQNITISLAPTPAMTGPISPPLKKGFAITSLVCSLVGVLACMGIILGPLAIIFGGLALRNANRQPQVYGGKGLATAGLIVGIVVTLTGFVWLIFI